MLKLFQKEWRMVNILKNNLCEISTPKPLEATILNYGYSIGETQSGKEKVLPLYSY